MDDETRELAVWEGEGGACLGMESPNNHPRLILIGRSLQTGGRELLRRPWASLVTFGAGLLIGSLLRRARAQ